MWANRLVYVRERGVEGRMRGGRREEGREGKVIIS